MTVLHFNPPVIAHRGASAYAPENTMAAFTKAAQLGIKWVEFDVMQAETGEPIIFHDDLLDRTTNGHGDVSTFSYAYLRSLDAGAWFNSLFSGEKIPSLMQVVDFLQEAKMSANIEIKATHGQDEKLVQRVFKEMGPLSTAPNFIFSSFSFAALRCLRQYSAHCQIGMLLHEWEPDWQDLCNSLQCVSVHVNQEIMTREAAKEIKDMGKVLLCYTVNDPKRARELFSYGVDAVFSDMPEEMVRLERASS